MRTINCLCGARLEADDAEGLVAAFAGHNREAHADLAISEQRLEDAYEAIRRSGGWDGERERLDDDILVRPLTPAMKDAYLSYFDHDAFKDNPSWASCYCLSYHTRFEPHAWEGRTAAHNRADRAAMIERGEASGVLAFAGPHVVGWCNASPRTALPWLDMTPGFACDDPANTGAIVCFAIAPQYRGQGIARRLLDGACAMLRDRGFALVQAYPPLAPRSDAGAYHGPLPIYLDAGFTKIRDAGRYAVVEKRLA